MQHFPKLKGSPLLAVSKPSADSAAADSQEKAVAISGAGIGIVIYLILLILFLMWYFASSPGGGGGGSGGKSGSGNGKGTGNAGDSDSASLQEGTSAAKSPETEAEGIKEQPTKNADSKTNDNPSPPATTPPPPNPTETKSQKSDEIPIITKKTPFAFGGSLAMESNPVNDAGTGTGPGVGGLQEFNERLEGAGAKTGDIQISLIWDNGNDIDLFVICPSSERIYFGDRQSQCNGELDIDMNAGGPDSNKPVENIYWPSGQAPQGNFKVYIDYYAQHIQQNATHYEVAIKVDGTIKTYKGVISRNQRYRLIHSFKR